MVPVAKSKSPIAGLVTVATTPSPTPEREDKIKTSQVFSN